MEPMKAPENREDTFIERIPYGYFSPMAIQHMAMGEGQTRLVGLRGIPGQILYSNH
jgi:hypothetical protein